MNTYAAKLDGAVGQLFIIGFAASKFKDIPISLVSLIMTVISLLAYLVGYLLWFVATLLYPDHPRKHQFWYGFAQFKQQYQLASLLGALACIICLTCPPLFIVPACWMFAVSNMLWTIAEYHKFQHPPTDNPNYSSERQAVYLRYVMLMTAVCILSTICITIVMICPALVFLAFIVPMTIGNLLTLAAFHYCGQCIFNDFKPDHSYAKLADKLSFDLNHQPVPEAMDEQPALRTYTKNIKPKNHRRTLHRHHALTINTHLTDPDLSPTEDREANIPAYK